MRKILFLLLPCVLLAAACTKNITDRNVDTKKASSVPGGTLFSTGVKSLTDGLTTADVNNNIFRHVVKHWGQATNEEEAQYDFATRAIPQAWWTRMYRDVLSDFQESTIVISNDNTLQPATKTNQLAIIDIMAVYTYNVLVNSFGNIPYTQAINNETLFPVYDDAKTVYADLLKRLVADIARLNVAGGGFSVTEDFVYKGNIAQWIRFANSLQLKMGMLLADVDDATAKATVEASEPKAITSAADNALVRYLAVPANNPLYNQLISAGRSDFIAAKDLMDPLNALNDPRKNKFFSTNKSGQYVGGIVGQAAAFTEMSKPDTARIAAPDAPGVLMDYVETEFFRAEAKERGYNVQGTAEQHYNNAITASILYWGGTAADAAAYLAQPAVAYSTAAGAWKQKIGFQKWIGLYNRPFDGWTEMKRLDFPQLPLPVGAKSGFPNRLPYPGNEQQLNGTNYTTAAAAIGGDKVETKLFWDKF